MPRGVKKENLPVKTCVVCGRPFNWRKKWERVWDEVTTCSKSCNRQRREEQQRFNRATRVKDGPLEALENGQEVDPNKVEIAASDAARTELAVDVVHLKIKESNAHFDSCCESEDSSGESITPLDPQSRLKAERKAARKAKKAARRAQRQGRGDPDTGKKPCDRCGRLVHLLVRCVHAESPAAWQLVCGHCWKDASGGVVDGDADHPHYRYGGLWKNRRAQQP